MLTSDIYTYQKLRLKEKHLCHLCCDLCATWDFISLGDNFTINLKDTIIPLNLAKVGVFTDNCMQKGGRYDGGDPHKLVKI